MDIVERLIQTEARIKSSRTIKSIIQDSDLKVFGDAIKEIEAGRRLHRELSLTLAHEKTRGDNCLSTSGQFLRALQGELTGKAPPKDVDPYPPNELLNMVRMLAERVAKNDA